MICGGSPCQDFSVAGNQKGSVWTCKDCENDDGTPFEWNPLTIHYTKRNKCPHCGSDNIDKTRSSLLVEYLRVIRANKPNFGIYENVKNIVGKQFKETTFKLFTDELEEYGYNVYWKVLNAKDYGIPQNRERVYVIFIKKDLDNVKFKFPEPFDNGIRLRDVLEDVVDEKYYLSDDKVQKFILNLNVEHLNIDKPCNSVKQVGNIVDTGNWENPQRGRIYSSNGCSPALNCCGGGGLEPKIIQVGKINSSQDGVVVSPDGIAKTHTSGHNNTPKIIQVCVDKSINNAKEIDCANCITSREDRGVSNRGSEGTAVIEIPNISYCIDVNYYKGITPEQYVEKRRRQLIFENGENVRIRKLIPLECFRLMGFTDEEFFRAIIGLSDKANEFIEQHPYLVGKTILDEAETIQGISNSRLYKQSGNSIVVDVLYYIYVELYKAMPYLFDDLRLSSFFSGIGAFESALDRLFKSIRTGNFTRPQVE